MPIHTLSWKSNNISGLRYENISPITLDKDWPLAGRLLLCTTLSIIGCISNGFFISSFFVEESLRRVGNVFTCFLGIADIMVTGVAFPISVVVMLSGDHATTATCHFQQFFFIASIYQYMLFYLLVSIENYMLVAGSVRQYGWLTSMRVGLLCGIVTSFSFGVAACSTFLGLEFDYCELVHIGSPIYRAVSVFFFTTMPLALTSAMLAAALNHVRKMAKDIQYKRTQRYDNELAQIRLNILIYAIFILSWCPLMYNMYLMRKLDGRSFYRSVWLGLMRSIFVPLVYSLSNASYRRAYAHLFNYCCCKSTLSNSMANRHRRAGDYKMVGMGGDVRVHIMHQAMNANSPQRSSHYHQQEL